MIYSLQNGRHFHQSDAIIWLIWISSAWNYLYGVFLDFRILVKSNFSIEIMATKNLCLWQKFDFFVAMISIKIGFDNYSKIKKNVI